MKEYDIKITETLEKTVQVKAASRKEAEAIAEENWNQSLYDMDSAEDYADVRFTAGEEREIAREDQIEVLKVSPGEYPCRVTVGIELKDLQSAVGGHIECFYPYEENIGLLVNEEGKINGSKLNRAVYGEDGNLLDVIAGDFLIVGMTEEGVGSLTEEQIKRYEEKFHQPQTFLRMGKGLMVLPVPESEIKPKDRPGKTAQEKAPETTACLPREPAR